MANIFTWAKKTPDKIALTEADSQRSISYSELIERALKFAGWLRKQNLVEKQGIAFLLENQIEILEISLGARFNGLYYTSISNHLTAQEILYIIENSGAKVLIISAATAPLIRTILETLKNTLDITLVSVEPIPDFPAIVLYNDIMEVQVSVPDLQHAKFMGQDLLYSSGTTGRPKGIRKELIPYTELEQEDEDIIPWRAYYGFNEDTVYLSTAPMYHAAPFRYLMRNLDSGGSAIIVKKFEPENTLRLMEQYKVTHSQWVPTMFIRLLRLSEEVRSKYDLSSLKVAIHAAAPCPINVKRAMIDWWGLTIYEYYAGSEAIGTTLISPQEWLEHPGSVGRATKGTIHIVDDHENELAKNEIGKIYFSGTSTFSYHNDPEKTKDAINEKGWKTYGDVGYLDDDGYLYLCDRRSDLILSGGVNVYPQEIESVLINHSAIEDIAVIGVSNEDFGEVPKAIISLRDFSQASEELALDIINFASDKLASLKLPHSIVFLENLARTESGKLSRQKLKEQYREQADIGIDVKKLKRQHSKT